MRKILAACLFALVATQAHATSKCSVKEYGSIGVAAGINAQIAQEPSIADQSIDITAGEAKSAAFNAATALVRVVCDAQAAYVVGTAPTAATTNSFLPLGLPEYFAVPINQAFKISLILRP